MKIIGITGGIGSGKSMISTFLCAMGIPVYIADAESKRITNTSPVIRQKLVEQLGTEVFEGDMLNKSLLASFIFGNEQHLKLVNSIIHPEVLNDFVSWTKKYEGFPLVAMESAILFESGFYEYMDEIWTVYAPLEIRIARVMRRDGLSRENVMSRINSQLPDEVKFGRSNVVIHNDDLQPLIPQIEKLLI